MWWIFNKSQSRLSQNDPGLNSHAERRLSPPPVVAEAAFLGNVSLFHPRRLISVSLQIQSVFSTAAEKN